MSVPSDPKIFEGEVRRLARALWPRASAKGPVMLDGRERDGVFDDGDVVHIIEATTSRRLDKTKLDLNKSIDLVRALRKTREDKSYKIWLVTLEDPTADQVDAAGKARKKARCPVETTSFRTFSSRLIDSAHYLQLRGHYPFGSVRNPADDNDFELPPSEFIPLDLLEKTSGSTIDHASLCALVLNNSSENLVLVGDYGSGKSMTLRSVYFELRDRHLKSEALRFPVYINLRDHFGQTDPAEALMRHAVKIGLADPNQLIAAWRAGSTFLMLDGFDEVSSARLVRGSEKVKKARREAVRLVRSFITESPTRSKILLSGREHYFDSEQEMLSALGLDADDRVFTLNEFSEEQINKYLAKKGITDIVPDWLPSRPLLLGYLAVKGVLGSESTQVLPQSAEEGWDYLLERVCEREASQIDPVVIETSAVRELVERLATSARNTTSGRGPIYLKNISEVYESIFDLPPDEKAETLILRLPGLTSSTAEGAREFIDDDFVDAARAGDSFRFVDNPYLDHPADLVNCASALGDIGVRTAGIRLKKSGATAKKINASLVEAQKQGCSPSCLLDIVKVMQELGVDMVTHEDIFIRDDFIQNFEVLPGPKARNLRFQDCYFGVLEVDTTALESNTPKFERCVIDELVGPVSKQDIPEGIIDQTTEISKIREEAKTNADILSLDIPLPVRVLMTVLRKLFFQAGSGRREGAFFRGLDNEARKYVPDVLQLLQAQRFASAQRIGGPIIWIPNRAKAKTAAEILSAPQTSQDRLLVAAKKL